MTFARLVTHYWRHAAWLEEGALLRDATKLRGVPGVMVNGRLDVSSPPDIPWMLAKVWTDAEVLILDEAAHGTGHPSVAGALVDATNRFAARGSS
jgi:proline iminopeptidase